MKSSTSFTQGNRFVSPGSKLIPKRIGSPDGAVIGEITDPQTLSVIRQQVGQYCCYVRGLLTELSATGSNAEKFLGAREVTWQMEKLIMSLDGDIAGIQRCQSALGASCDEMASCRRTDESRDSRYFAYHPFDEGKILFISGNNSSAHHKWFGELSIEIDEKEYQLVIESSVSTLNVWITENRLPRFASFNELAATKGMGN